MRISVFKNVTKGFTKSGISRSNLISLFPRVVSDHTGVLEVGSGTTPFVVDALAPTISSISGLLFGGAVIGEGISASFGVMLAAWI